MAEYAPFDPTDPAERVADTFRKKVAEMALAAMQEPDYAGLSPIDQVSATMAGILTGLVGVLFSSITPDGRDTMIEEMAAYLPQARDNATSILDIN